MASRRLLKRDALGTIAVVDDPHGPQIIRETGDAVRGLRWLARWLARREAAAMSRLSGITGVPQLISCEHGRLTRSYLAGQPLHRAEPPTAAYFIRARWLLRQIHRAGIAHNDLAKEANWLSLQDECCAIVDFQLATFSRRKGRLFRLLAREDLRHLLKHKHHYVPAALSPRERAILMKPSLPARLWRRCVKPIYHFVTRRLLGWPEREGADER